VLVDYLKELRTKARPGPLSERLRTVIPEADARFLAHCATLNDRVLPASRVSAANQ
jgi:hypothetical protein